jgi:hypothetical protein
VDPSRHDQDGPMLGKSISCLFVMDIFILVSELDETFFMMYLHIVVYRMVRNTIHHSECGGKSYNINYQSKVDHVPDVQFTQQDYQSIEHVKYS